MDKTSYRILTLTVGCLLLLSTTAQQVIAWPCTPTSCPPCYTCLPTGCEYDCDAGWICCGGSCSRASSCACCNNQRCCTPGDECCTDSGAGDAYCCAGGKTCCDKACCGPLKPKCCDDIGGDDDGYCCDSDKTCCKGDCCDPDYCKTCVDGSCQVCGGDPNQFCCDGSCCPDDKCCVDGECLKFGCDPTFDITVSGECWCYAFECGGTVVWTFTWYCEERDEGCPPGTECVETKQIKCYYKRYFDCVGECLVSGDECELSYSSCTKRDRCLCGCCDW